MHLRIVGMLVAALWSARAVAVEDCEAGGKAINLNNGASTATLTGVVKCHDRDAGTPTREIAYKDGKQDGWTKDLRSMWGNGPKWIEYQAGKTTGCRKVFDAQKPSQLAQEATCKDGHPLIEKYYWPSGQLKQLATHRSADDNDVFRVRYDEQGRIDELRCGSTVEITAGMPTCPYAHQTTVVKSYYAKGGVKYVWPFKDGLLEGNLELHQPDGTLSKSTAYHAGVRAGAQQEFDAHGQLSSATTYQGKLREGDDQGYFPGGQLSYLLTWSANKLIRARVYYQNSQVRLDLKRDGTKVNGRGFWDLGKVQFEGQYLVESEDAFAEAVRWQLPARTPSLDEWLGYGRGSFTPIGVQQTYFESGKSQEIANYDGQGRRQGSDEVFWESGQPREETVYAEDVLVSRKSYDEQGQLTLDEDYFPDGSRKAKRK